MLDRSTARSVRRPLCAARIMVTHMSREKKSPLPAYLPRTLAYVHAHMDEPLCLDALSAVSGVSAFHLQRAFKQAMGHSPSRRMQLLRLKRASMRLVFQPHRPITDIAFEAGYQNAESFTRAFRKRVGQSPGEFRHAPDWPKWRSLFTFPSSVEPLPMQVEIVQFPETPVAAVEHCGSTANVYESTRKLIEWRIRNGVPPEGHHTYGVHYDMRTYANSGYRLDICVSFDREVTANPQGVVAKVIPGGRCARVRHQGSREYIPVVAPLFTEWLPASGEQLRDFPVFFHYVNVGPAVREHEMITDVYLPLR
jgi:AraC family transcriptional regulator